MVNLLTSEYSKVVENYHRDMYLIESKYKDDLHFVKTANEWQAKYIIFLESRTCLDRIMVFLRISSNQALFNEYNKDPS